MIPILQHNCVADSANTDCICTFHTNVHIVATTGMILAPHSSGTPSPFIRHTVPSIVCPSVPPYVLRSVRLSLPGSLPPIPLFPSLSHFSCYHCPNAFTQSSIHLPLRHHHAFAVDNLPLPLTHRYLVVAPVPIALVCRNNYNALRRLGHDTDE